MPTDRDQVFICYSHEDDKWRMRIQTALAPLLRGGIVKAWDDKKILPGSDWRKEITQALAQARVGLLLVSPDSIASDFIMQEELPVLELATQRGELRLLWVPLRHCLWEHTPLARYQAAWDTKHPLSSLSSSAQDEAITAICRHIEAAFNSPATAKPDMPIQSSQSVEDIIANGKNQRLKALAEDHAAVTRQLTEAIESVQIQRLKRQVAGIEEEMRELGQ